MNALEKELQSMSISELDLSVHNPKNTEPGEKNDVMDPANYLEGTWIFI